MLLTVDYLIDVSELPTDLAKALNDPTQPLYDTAQIYQKLVATDLLWRVWAIDEEKQIWVEVNFLNGQGDEEFHTLKLDEGTYQKIDYDVYPIECL